MSLATLHFFGLIVSALFGGVRGLSQMQPRRGRRIARRGSRFVRSDWGY